MHASLWHSSCCSIECIFVLGQISDTWNTCTVKNGGTNDDCAAANKNENTCDVATSSGGAGVPANKCIFVDNHPDGIKAVCAGCAAGMYSADKGSSFCTDCLFGEYQPDIGKVACIECPTLKVAAATTREKCTECIQGHYSTAGDGQTSSNVCKKCAGGTYSKETGVTSEDECIPCTKIGYFCPEGSSNQDDKCPKGTYADEAGLTECKVCPEGYYQSEEAQTNCSACDMGTFLSDKDRPTYHGE